MKRTIEIEDTLQEIVTTAQGELKDLLLNYLEKNPDLDDTPCLSNDIDYDGRFHEMVDSSVPVYTSEINDIFYLYGDEIEEAFDNAGIGDKKDDEWPAGWKAAAIYCYIEQECWSWWHDNADDIFNEWKGKQDNEEFIEVSEEEFWAGIGDQNVHPEIIGNIWPYTSDFMTPTGQVKGRIIKHIPKGKGLPVERYYLTK